MTALTVMPSPGLSQPPQLPHLAHRPHLVDAPVDHKRRFGLGEGRRVHRFPAATFLDRTVAREERDVARDALEASDRAASRRIAGLGTLAALLFAATIALLATGHGTSGTGLLALWGMGAGIAALVMALVAVLRQHERERDVLTQRVRMYETRLARRGLR